MSTSYIRILDIPFLNTTRASFTQLLQEYIHQNKKAFIVTANPEIVVQAQENPSYRAHIQNASYIIADGIGIVQASKLAKRPLPERVSGFDVMNDLMRQSVPLQQTIYLLGSKSPVLEKAINHLREKYPGIQIIGSHHGYFTAEENAGIVQEIQALQPDLIFVALGCPLQETWIAENFHHFTKGIFMGIGGGFDVFAGVVRRAPDSWIRMNLEWLYRFMHQPTRMKRMVFIPKFGYLILKRKLSNSL